MFILCGFFSTDLYASVSCAKPLHLLPNQRGYKFQCNGQEGYIFSGAHLEAITVQVLNNSNQIIMEKTLQNPRPSRVDRFLFNEDVNRNEWIAQQIPNLKRSDRVIVKPGGYVFSDYTEMYKDPQITISSVIGELGDIIKNSSAQKIRIQCEYTNKVSMFRSKLCPKELLCMSDVKCRDLDKNYDVNGTAICRAKGQKCPTPSQCVLDDSQHVYDSQPTAPNYERLRQYDMYGREPENAPVEVEGPSSAGGSVQ